MDKNIKNSQEKITFDYSKYVLDLFKSFSENPNDFEKLRNMEEKIKKPKTAKIDLNLFDKEIQDLKNIEDDYDEFRKQKDEIFKKLIYINMSLQEEIRKPWVNPKNLEQIKTIINDQEKLYIDKITKID